MTDFKYKHKIEFMKHTFSVKKIKQTNFIQTPFEFHKKIFLLGIITNNNNFNKSFIFIDNWQSQNSLSHNPQPLSESMIDLTKPFFQLSTQNCLR